MSEPPPDTPHAPEPPDQRDPSEAPPADQEQEWPHSCPTCGTELQQATVDMDDAKLPRPEYRPGEYVAVTFCPNPDCPEHPSRSDG